MKNDAQLNHKIKSHRVILIDVDGNKMGEFLRDDAIELAESRELDLVVVAQSDPPICKIMDYGKFLYQQKKKNRSNAPVSKLKEVKLTPVTDTHDFDVILGRAKKFLEKGHKVKVTVVMKGRLRNFKDQAYGMCNDFREALGSLAQVDSPPQLNGKYLTMVLTRKSA